MFSSDCLLLTSLANCSDIEHVQICRRLKKKVIRKAVTQIISRLTRRLIYCYLRNSVNSDGMICNWKLLPGKKTHLVVTQSCHLVHKLLLDHEGGQVGSVAGEEDDGEEGPHGHDELASGAFGVLHRDGVVEDQTPEQPHRLAHGERGSVWVWKNSTPKINSSFCNYNSVRYTSKSNWCFYLFARSQEVAL